MRRKPTFSAHTFKCANFFFEFVAVVNQNFRELEQAVTTAGEALLKSQAQFQLFQFFNFFNYNFF